MALAALLAAACDSGSPETTADDATTASGDGDGPTSTSGDGDGDGDGNALVLEFEAVPSVPGEARGDFDPTFAVASVSVRDVRVIGDAGALSAQTATLDWTESSIVALRYAPVAPGLYSRVRGEVGALDLQGTIELEGQRRPFEIRASGNMLAEFSTDIEASVGANQDVTVTITADLEDLVDSIDWESACASDRCDIGSSDPAFESVLDAVEDLFESDDDDDDDDDEGDEGGDGSGGEGDGDESSRDDSET